MRRCLALVIILVALGADRGSAALRPLPGASVDVQGIRYSHPSSIRYAAGERLFYVADTGNRRIVLLHTDLEPLDAVSLIPLGLRPFCVLPRGDGTSWVSDLDRSDLYKIDARGNCVDTLRLGPHATPGRMAWGRPGELLLIDRVSRTVLRIDEMHPTRPESLKVPGEGVIEDVASYPDGAIEVVSATGTPIWTRDSRSGAWRSFGEHGVGPDQYSFPVAICPDRLGRCWVVDAFRHEVRSLGPDRKTLDRILSEPGKPPLLQFPVSAGMAAGDTIVVLERGACRVQRFARLP